MLVAEKSLQQQPASIEGLGALVGAHPAYQVRYAEILDLLPGGLGSWAASAFDTVLTSPAASVKLSAAKEKWKKQGGPTLKRALSVSWDNPRVREL